MEAPCEARNGQERPSTLAAANGCRRKQSSSLTARVPSRPTPAVHRLKRASVRFVRRFASIRSTAHYLGLALLVAGQHEAALSRLQKSDNLLGQVPFSRGDLGYGLAVSGRGSEAEPMLKDMMRRQSEGYYPAFPLALIHLGLDRTEAALEWLEKAVDERHVGFYLPSVGPFYDALRDQPRFRRVLQRINVEL